MLHEDIRAMPDWQPLLIIHNKGKSANQKQFIGGGTQVNFSAIICYSTAPLNLIEVVVIIMNNNYQKCNFNFQLNIS